jgi:hypothetical protein
MKKFENPEIDVQKFSVEDVITTSELEKDDDMTDKA